ncbi:MAG TPA: FAD-binding oxidoreductase [Desulfobacterales bacterium]|nr:FAD-binding oxidoreductase [Desulfobacterales bacterium]HIP38007.1 FAD-binding oxidoreductase [Desulfocapsa sulfexigens]
MARERYTAFVEAISSVIPEEQIFTDTLRCLAHGTDGGFYRLEPKVVVRVLTEEEMIRCLQEAHSRGLPVTFKAAGTSLSGQTISDSILLMASEGWERYDVLENGAKIRLQPGIIGSRVNTILAPYGRKFGPDPASINSAMVGGIIINNGSGMNCGTHANSYKTIVSARIVFADGTLLDTGNTKSRNNFRKQRPEFIRKIEKFRDQVRRDTAFAARIRKKYSIKNTTGFSINSFIDYDDPFHIILNLLVGSEGTLAFISEVVMRSVKSHSCKASSMVYFPDINTACEAVVALKDGPVEGAELLDRGALRAVENMDGIPSFIKDFDETTTAVLLESMAADPVALEKNIKEITTTLNSFATILPVEFTSDPQKYEKLWNIRKGVFPAVGGMRDIGTTCLIEDVAYHMETLPAATKELQEIIARHGYQESVIYGHALEGNFHFIINQDFSDPAEVARYDEMMHDVVAMTVDKYDGSLKAEHGTGRNMAPFVKKEWGEKGYGLMQEIKQLFDPDGILNPGVIINDDPQCHLKNLKPLPKCDPLVDKCIECGFCEVGCVSNGFSLSARQRIVIQREIARLTETGEDPGRKMELERDFIFLGVETCAADGLCATSCPVGIDTGKYIKQIRGRQLSHAGMKLGQWAANHLEAVTTTASFMLDAVNIGHGLLGTHAFGRLSNLARSLSIGRLPEWTPAMPKGATVSGLISRNSDTADKVVYFPSCIARTMGPGRDDPVTESIPEVTVRLFEKAGYEVIFPEAMKKLCCGTPWESKGFADIADQKSAELEHALLAASNNGKYPVLCDTSPCLYRMRKVMTEKLKLFEPVEFVHTFLVDRLQFRKKKNIVAVHPTCSTRKMGLAELLEDVAGMCAKKVVVPQDLNCCGFAGDKGFTLPDLNRHGLRKSIPMVQQSGAEAGYSNSRTCEIGCASHTGIPYMSIMYLVDEVSQPKEEI